MPTIPATALIVPQNVSIENFNTPLITPVVNGDPDTVWDTDTGTYTYSAATSFNRATTMVGQLSAEDIALITDNTVESVTVHLTVEYDEDAGHAADQPDIIVQIGYWTSSTDLNLVQQDAVEGDRDAFHLPTPAMASYSSSTFAPVNEFTLATMEQIVAALQTGRVSVTTPIKNAYGANHSTYVTTYTLYFEVDYLMTIAEPTGIADLEVRRRFTR